MTDATEASGDGICGAVRKDKRTGKDKPPCGRPKGWGTSHPGIGSCKHHGGSTPNHTKAAAVVSAKRAVAFYGLPREVDPFEALVEELHRTAGHVAWLEQIIRAGEITKELNPSGRRRVVKLDQAVFGGGDQPSVWLDLYERERKHLKDVAKTCIALGMEERKVRLAEQQGQVIADVLRAVLGELGVLDRPEVPGIVRRHLTLVAGHSA